MKILPGRKRGRERWTGRNRHARDSEEPRFTPGRYSGKATKVRADCAGGCHRGGQDGPKMSPSGPVISQVGRKTGRLRCLWRRFQVSCAEDTISVAAGTNALGE